MKDVTHAPSLSPDQRRLLQQLLKASIDATEKRLQQLGLVVGDLLDPEAPMHNQVAQLRHSFLLGEQAALKFAFDDPNHWRVIRARLQPIVVAYQTHERFVQSVLNGFDSRSDDALIAIYKERLQNSERFREILFDLEKKIKSGELETTGGDDDISALLPSNELHDLHKNQFRTEDDTASIQNNVLTQLSRQIKELERREQEYQKTLLIKEREIAAIVGERDHTIGQLEKVERELARTKEETLSLRLVADAAKRAMSGDAEAIAVPEVISLEQGAGQVPSLDALAGEGDAAFWQNRVQELQAEVASMSTAAYNAYMASSDMSIVILFMLSSFNSNTFDRLGTEILRTVSTYGVKPTVSIMTDTGPKYFSGPNALTNANSLIETRRSRGRIVEEGSTLIIYEDRIVLLVPDMPVNDRPRYERLRDNLSTLVKGAAARAEAVSLAQAAEKQKQQMERLLMKSDEVFKGVARNLEKQQLRLIKHVQLAMQDIRGGLAIAPGDPKSITLTSRMKKLEESLRGLFNPDELMDPAFTKNVAKVAANLKDKEK